MIAYPRAKILAPAARNNEATREARLVIALIVAALMLTFIAVQLLRSEGRVSKLEGSVAALQSNDRAQDHQISGLVNIAGSQQDVLEQATRLVEGVVSNQSKMIVLYTKEHRKRRQLANAR